MNNFESSSSTTVLGLGGLVNRNETKHNINLKNTELECLSDISIQTKPIRAGGSSSSNVIYNKEVKDMAEEIGLDLDNISVLLDDPKMPSSTLEPLPIQHHTPYPPTHHTPEHHNNIPLSPHNSEYHNTAAYPTMPPPRNDYPSLQERFVHRAEHKKSENDRHNIFNNVLNNVKQSNSEFIPDIYTEELKNKKSMLLEQIQLLILLLKEENEDVSSIPEVTEEDTMEKLEHIYKLLKIKKDRNQFSTLGEEIIMFGVHLLESFFNGERVIFGKFKPDLRGWHNSVAVKLRKMKYETSTAISDIVQTYNINYGTRLAIELIPSLFLYSNMKSVCKKKYSKHNLQDNLSNIDI